MEISALQEARGCYRTRLPRRVNSSIGEVRCKREEIPQGEEGLSALFPHVARQPIVRLTTDSGGSQIEPRALKVGVVLSGGQAPGGHNVIAGLFDALQKSDERSKLYGFLGGPSGILEADYKILSKELIDAYRNTGGFDLIGSGRTKIEEEKTFRRALENCRKMGLEALVVIGGDDSNTNAAFLAEYFEAHNAGIQVVGCPKTIDGDLKNPYIEASFGFDTATKIFSGLIGNIARDAASSKKYWHFIKLMGRSASHTALECALQTGVNVTIISEEVKARNVGLVDLVDYVASVVKKRAEAGRNYGIVVVPEGLVEFIPEMETLISQLNEILASYGSAFSALSKGEEQISWISEHLSPAARDLFLSLPKEIQGQLLMSRDPHGNVQVSLIETEKMLASMVAERLKELSVEKFTPLPHFFGYESRSAFPSNFDANYAYTLGYTACLLVLSGCTGYLAGVQELHREVEEWVPGGIPLTTLMHKERRHGKEKPVIRKSLVDLGGAPFKYFAARRKSWESSDAYLFPGAPQYYGPSKICDRPTATLLLEKGSEIA